MPFEYECLQGDKVLGTVTTVPRNVVGCFPKLPLKNVKINGNNLTADVALDDMSAFERLMFKSRNILKNKIS